MAHNICTKHGQSCGMPTYTSQLKHPPLCYPALVRALQFQTVHLNTFRPLSVSGASSHLSCQLAVSLQPTQQGPSFHLLSVFNVHFCAQTHTTHRMKRRSEISITLRICTTHFTAMHTFPPKNVTLHQSSRITSVRLRREAHTDAFRGSVYVEFESVSGASSAVAHPPCQLKSTERLQIMFKAEYDQKRASSSAHTPGKVSSKSGPGSGSRSEHAGKVSSRQSGQHAAAAHTSGSKRSHGEASGGTWQQSGGQQQHWSGANPSATLAVPGSHFVPPLPPPPPNGQAWAGLGGPPGGGPVNDRLAEMQQQLEQVRVVKLSAEEAESVPKSVTCDSLTSCTLE